MGGVTQPVAPPRDNQPRAEHDPQHADSHAGGHRPNARLVARGLVTDSEGRWLLVQNVAEADSKPVIPGGHVEDDESPRAACTREVGEEAGVRVEAGRLLTIGWEPPNGHPSTRTTLIFECRALNTDTAQPQRTVTDGEHITTWMTPREALTVLRPDIATALAMWCQNPSVDGTLYIEDPAAVQRRALLAMIHTVAPGAVSETVRRIA
jgi:ADP-ribose pyrophosphatase YjhB (NUDIX family)